MNPALLASKRHDWRTPEDLLDDVRKLGPIVLDPCTGPDNPVGARRFYTEVDDGLTTPWATEVGEGEVCYVNSPFGRELPRWVARCAEKGRLIREHWGMLVELTPARPGTRWFKQAWKAADAVCFLDGRLCFLDPDFGEAGEPAPFPCAVWYYGMGMMRFLEVFEKRGVVAILPTYWSESAQRLTRAGVLGTAPTPPDSDPKDAPSPSGPGDPPSNA